MRWRRIGRRNADVGAADHQAPLRRRTLACVDGAILEQESEYPVAPPASVTLGRDTGVVPPRVLQERSQQRRLSPIQLRCRLSKVVLGRCFRSVDMRSRSVVAPLGSVQVDLEDLFLRE